MQVLIKLDGCIVSNKHKTVFGSKAISAQAVYLLHSTMPSVTCLRLSYVSVICHVTFLQFSIQACFSFLSVSQAAQRRSWFTQYQTSALPKISVGRFLVRKNGPGEWFWTDSNGKNGNKYARLLWLTYIYRPTRMMILRPQAARFHERRISSVSFTSAHLYGNVYIPVSVARALVHSFDFEFFGEQSSQKWANSCLGHRWTAVQNLMPLALSSA